MTYSARETCYSEVIPVNNLFNEICESNLTVNLQLEKMSENIDTNQAQTWKPQKENNVEQRVLFYCEQ